MQAPRRPGPVAATPTAAQSNDRSVQADAQAGPGRAPGVYHGGRSTRNLGPQAPRKFTRPELVEQVKRKRKTDKFDARALCLRLSRWLEGNGEELAPIRIPTVEEQRRRETTRRRQFLKRQIRALANRGHGQVAEYCHQKLPHRWWGPRHWKKLSSTLDPWLLGVLNKLRELILAMEGQLAGLEAEILASVKHLKAPKGLGELSLAILEAEVCDWERFGNRKQVGSYTGCCPGEHSSGGKRRLGCIDRMGNGRVRSILVETVWRLLVWQPFWKSARKMKLKLLDGPAMRKKAVVALARQLAIDLWRWRTGRANLGDLGWFPR